MITLLFFFLLLLFHGASVVCHCFHPDGSQDDWGLPCNLPASVSNLTICCSVGWACTNNGICAITQASTDFRGAPWYARGSCTDQSWGSTCPNLCTTEPYSNNTDAGLEKCTTGQDNSYCCDEEACDCSTGNGTIVFDTDITVTTIGTPSSTSTTSFTSTSSTLASSALTTPTTSLISTDSIPAASVTSITNPPATSSAAPASSGPSNYGFVIGLALGIPAALFALGVCWYLFRRNKKQKQKVALDESATDHNPSKPYDPEPTLATQPTPPPPGYEALTQQAHEKPGDFEFRQSPVEMAVQPRLPLITLDCSQAHELA